MDSDGLHKEGMSRATFWTEFLALADMGLIVAGPMRGALVTAEVTPRGRLILQEEIRNMALTPDPSTAQDAALRPSGREEEEAAEEEKEGGDAALES